MKDLDAPKLFMVLLGCKPVGRLTEQHDIFFSIGNSIADLKSAIADFWPEAKGQIHIDAWREVTAVPGYRLQVLPLADRVPGDSKKLFFINLGGYKMGEFDEPHYKMLIAADTLGEASKTAKETAFYKHMGFEGAVSHIDDKYGVDVDDVFEIADVLSADLKRKFYIHLEPDNGIREDQLNLGYLPLSKI